ncbi:MAG: hypothetical protein ACRC1K_14240 [Planctomycetia bacterium]
MRVVMAVSILGLVLSGTASSLPQSSNQAVSLADAVKAFNEKVANHHIGKNEAPITEEEVVAAIRASERPDELAVSDTMYNDFKRIADARRLPQGAFLEPIGGGWDPGGAFIYDVWWVRITMPKEDGGSYSFRIRERILRSRSLSEELIQAENRLKEFPLGPGRYKLEDRVEELKARIAKMKAV